MPYPDKGALNLKAGADKNGCVFQKEKKKKNPKDKEYFAVLAKWR